MRKYNPSIQAAWPFFAMSTFGGNMVQTTQGATFKIYVPGLSGVTQPVALLSVWLVGDVVVVQQEDTRCAYTRVDVWFWARDL